MNVDLHELLWVSFVSALGGRAVGPRFRGDDGGVEPRIVIPAKAGIYRPSSRHAHPPIMPWFNREFQGDSLIEYC